MMRLHRMCCAFVAFSVSILQCFAEGPEFVDPASADRSYGVQGEYSGQIETRDGKVDVGVQVVSLGKVGFRLIGYRGGLPGAGWSGQTRREAEGQWKDDVVDFQGDRFSIRWSNDQLTFSAS